MNKIFITDALRSTHKKENFDCGKDLLSGYIQKQASQDVKRRLSACFILADEDNIVKGYYTLSSSSIQRDQLPPDLVKRLPGSYSNLPVTLLGRLAIDRILIGQGFGELLLVDALKRAYFASSESVASMAVVTDPIDQNAINFYSKYGFIMLPDSKKMFLTMDTIAKLFF
jgi:predicted GNAT family N-acyltransferase